MTFQATASPEWGHALVCPDGQIIRIPLFAFPKLRQLGLLKRNGARLSEAVYDRLKPEYDSITDGLRQLIGSDLSGPAWCVCHCRECQAKASDIDHTRTPIEQMRYEHEIAARVVKDVKARRARR